MSKKSSKVMKTGLRVSLERGDSDGKPPESQWIQCTAFSEPLLLIKCQLHILHLHNGLQHTDNNPNKQTGVVKTQNLHEIFQYLATFSTFNSTAPG